MMATVYLTIREALSYLDTTEEQRARRLLEDALYRCERQHGRLPREAGDLSRLLYQRYHDVLRAAGNLILRLEEMIYGSGHGPRPEDESESSYTIEQAFNAGASRGRDSSPTGETEQERWQRYQQSTLGEVSSPQFWQAVHHFPESDSSEEWARREQEAEARHTREVEDGVEGEHGGESETAVEATPEGEEVSEYGEGRYNAFNNMEPEGEPVSLLARLRAGRDPPTYPGLHKLTKFVVIVTPVKVSILDVTAIRKG